MIRSAGRRLFSCVVVWLAFVAWARPAGAAEIWLAGMDPFVRHALQPGDPSDYLALFEPDAPWPRAAAAVRVFKTSTQFLLNAPEDELRRMFDGLRQRGIALAMAGLMLPRTGGCGQGVEGYASPGMIKAAAERTKRLGGVIAAVAMDEPLWFGNRYRGAHACASSVEDVARGAAQSVADLRAVFPAAAVGDVEPLDMAAPEAWAADMMRFAAAFAAATGRTLDFVDIDVAWQQSWRPALTAVMRRVRAAHLRFGIIYDGDPEDDADAVWTRHAAERFDTVEADADLAPDRAILQTWMLHPAHMLPETAAGTMTNLVLQYLRPGSRIAIRVRHGRASGRLTAASGEPIAGATVTVTQVDHGAVPRLALQRIDGRVPHGAVRALLGLRLNTECNCRGAGVVGIGAAVYAPEDGRAVRLAPPAFGPDAASSMAFGNAPMIVKVTPGSTMLVNGGSFAVAAGARFELSVLLGEAGGGADVGYVAIIFLDAGGAGVRRQIIRFGPVAVRIADTVTDRQGRFSAVLPAGVRIPAAEWRAAFAGDDRWRGAMATTDAVR